MLEFFTVPNREITPTKNWRRFSTICACNSIIAIFSSKEKPSRSNRKSSNNNSSKSSSIRIRASALSRRKRRLPLEIGVNFGKESKATTRNWKHHHPPGKLEMRQSRRRPIPSHVNNVHPAGITSSKDMEEEVKEEEEDMEEKEIMWTWIREEESFLRLL